MLANRSIGFGAALLAATLISSAQPVRASLVFSGSDLGGSAAATMDFDRSGNVLTVSIDNTSPTVLDSGSGVNSPGITGFGFNLENQADLMSWELDALDSSGDLVVIGGTSGGDWKLGTTSSGVTLDFQFHSVNGSKGALYNPSAVGGYGGPPLYFTRATLTAVFDAPPHVVISDGGVSPYVRFKNVGLDGEGSLKLTATNPEPSSLALMGVGVLGLVCYRRRIRRRV